MESQLPYRFGVEHEMSVNVGIPNRNSPEAFPAFTPLYGSGVYSTNRSQASRELVQILGKKILPLGGTAYLDVQLVEAVSPETPGGISAWAGMVHLMQEIESEAIGELHDLLPEDYWLRFDIRNNDSHGNTWGTHFNYSFKGTLDHIEVPTSTRWLNNLNLFGPLVYGQGTFTSPMSVLPQGSIFLSQKTTHSAFTSSHRNRVELKHTTSNISPWATAMQIGLHAIALSLDNLPREEAPTDTPDAPNLSAAGRDSAPFNKGFVGQARNFLYRLSDEAYDSFESDPLFYEHGYDRLLSALHRYLEDVKPIDSLTGSKVMSDEQLELLADRSDWAAKLLMARQTAKRKPEIEQKVAHLYADQIYACELFTPKGIHAHRPSRERLHFDETLIRPMLRIAPAGLPTVRAWAAQQKYDPHTVHQRLRHVLPGSIQSVNPKELEAKVYEAATNDLQEADSMFHDISISLTADHKLESAESFASLITDPETQSDAKMGLIDAYSAINRFKDSLRLLASLPEIKQQQIRTRVQKITALFGNQLFEEVNSMIEDIEDQVERDELLGRSVVYLIQADELDRAVENTEKIIIRELQQTAYNRLYRALENSGYIVYQHLNSTYDPQAKKDLVYFGLTKLALQDKNKVLTRRYSAMVEDEALKLELHNIFLRHGRRGY